MDNNVLNMHYVGKYTKLKNHDYGKSRIHGAGNEYGVVYLISFKDFDHVKIGSTHDPYDRFQSLQTEFGKRDNPIDDIAISRFIRNPRDVERCIHGILGEYRKANSELFRISFDRALHIIQSSEINVKLPVANDTYPPNGRCSNVDWELYRGTADDAFIDGAQILEKLAGKSYKTKDRDGFIPLEYSGTPIHSDNIQCGMYITDFVDYMITHHLSLDSVTVYKWLVDNGIMYNIFFPSNEMLRIGVIKTKADLLPNGKYRSGPYIDERYINCIATALWYDLVYGTTDYDKGIDPDGFIRLQRKPGFNERFDMMFGG